jgi:hypothetical protein
MHAEKSVTHPLDYTPPPSGSIVEGATDVGLWTAAAPQGPHDSSAFDRRINRIS